MSHMRLTFLLAATIVVTSPSFAQEYFNPRVVISKLNVPWEILWGPDDFLWFTERGGRVSRMDPETGEREILLDRSDIMHPIMEGGMLGLALHPDFPDSPYVFTGYVTSQPGVAMSKLFLRYRFDGKELTDSTILLKQDSTTEWHQGGRMIIGPDRKLYITNGELPRQDLVHDSMSIYGKVLRMNLDGSIPSDNPVEGSYMWSYGHRNQQGLCFLPNGDLLASEHGPDIEDEINRIERGGNYGWPFVNGPCDVEEEQEYCAKNNPIPPVWSTGAETYALSGMKYYPEDGIYADFRRSVLVASLKHSRVTRLRLDDSYRSIADVRNFFEYAYGRIRDICISPTGRIFIGTSNTGVLNEFEQREIYDAIIELVPAHDTARAVPKAFVDTTVVECAVGDGRTFDVAIRNVGTAPLRVSSAWCAFDSKAIGGVSTRIPFEVPPGDYFSGMMYYSPKDAGPHDDRVIFEFENDSIAPIAVHVRGITDIGWIAAGADSVFSTVVTDSTFTIYVPLSNPGTQPITFRTFHSDDHAFREITVAENYDRTILPSDTIMVPVQVRSVSPGKRTVHLRTRSSSYKETDVKFVYVSEQAVSVHEGIKTPSDLTVWPNPTNGEVVVDGLPLDGVVEVSVLDVTGRLVQTMTGVSIGGRLHLEMASTSARSGYHTLRMHISDRIFAVPIVIAR